MEIARSLYLSFFTLLYFYWSVWPEEFNIVLLFCREMVKENKFSYNFFIIYLHHRINKFNTLNHINQ